MSLITSTTMLIDAILPAKVWSAEQVRFLVAGPLDVSVSLETLETFAKTGERKGNLKLIAGFLDEETLNFDPQSPKPTD